VGLRWLPLWIPTRRRIELGGGFGWPLCFRAVQLSELFSPEDLVVPLDPDDKWDAIMSLIDHLVGRGSISEESRTVVEEAVFERERSMSTGMERGIAIPHAAVDDLEEIGACMGIVTREGGLDFEGIDGDPTHFVVLLVIPRAQKLAHIRTLADVARVLGTDSVRSDLLVAGSAGDAWKVMAQA